MKTIYIIKTGTTFPNTLSTHGDFDQWTLDAIGNQMFPIAIIDVENGASLPKTADCGGVIVLGSHAMVTEKLPWSVEIEKWIPELIQHQIPFLGICYGHQLLAQATGGTVGYHEKGKEIGTVNILCTQEKTDDSFMGQTPDQFLGHVTHAQTVLTLPEKAVRLAYNDFEPNHAFRIGKNSWGLQFHPEYTEDIMKVYVENQAEELTAAGKNINDVIAGIQSTPHATHLLKRFCNLCCA